MKLDSTNFNRERVRKAVYELVENHSFTSEMISEWLIWLFVDDQYTSFGSLSARLERGKAA